MLKVVPFPLADSTAMCPPCLFTTEYDTASPSPLAFSLVVKNGSKTLERFFLGMPDPVSLTSILTYLRLRGRACL